VTEPAETEPAAAPRIRLKPGPRPATPGDLRAAQERDRLLRTELPRVRETATAWRNGLGALLVALVGFGLIKGRTDVGQLATGWGVWVGVMLLAALTMGAIGALLLIRAAHGRPAVADIRLLPSSRASSHIEAVASAAALRWGIVSTLGCTLLLVGAVGATWYGPDRTKPALKVTSPAGSLCGSVVRLDRGTLVLKTSAGEVTIDLSTASAMATADTCP
jgi:hypothetical protein